MRTIPEPSTPQPPGAPNLGRILAALAFTLAVALVGGSWFASEQKLQLQLEAETELASIARFKLEQIENWKRERLGDAAVIMENPQLSQSIALFLKNPNASGAEGLRRILLSLKWNYTYFDVLLVDVDKRIRLSASGRDEAQLELEPALRRARDEHRPVLTDIHVDPDDEDPHVSVIAPLFVGNAPKGPFLGAVVLKMSAGRFLYPLLQTWPTNSRTAETFLVRRDGADALFMSDPLHRPGAALKLRIPLSRTDVLAVLAASGQRGLAHARDDRGIEVAAFLNEIPDTPWVMVSKMDMEEVFADWHRQARFIFALFACLLAGLAGTALLAWQRLQKKHFRSLFFAEARLRESLELQSATLASLGEGVIAVDAQGRVTLLNAAAEGLTGWSLEKAQGRSIDEFFQLIHEETRQKAASPVSRALAEGVATGPARDALLLAEDGEDLPVAYSAAPIRNGQGEVVGAVLVFRSCIAERQAERAKEALSASEERYRELVQNATSIILKLDSAGRITFFNEYAQEFFGYSEGEILGRHALGTIVPEFDTLNRDMGEMVRALVDKPAEHGLVENENMRRDGGRVWVRWANKPIFDAQGQAAGVLSVGTDITDRKQGQEELLMRLRIMEQTPASIIVTDQDGTIEYVNPFFTRLTGYSAEEAVGQNPRLLKSGLHDAAFYKDLWETISSGGVWRGELLNRRKDGTTYWEDASISPVSSAQGQITHYVAVKEDITGKKELDELKEDMERIARHDLKTPLMGILGVPDLLLTHDNLTGEQRGYLQMMLDSGHQLLGMINLSLDLYRMERGIYELTPARVDMLQVARRAVADLSQQGRVSGVSVQILVEGRPATERDSCPCLGEELLCYSMFTNLIRNALEASPKGETVSITMSSKGGCRIAIRNRGGVPPEFRERFFLKYATFGKKGGMGLGTYSARLMARSMGGDIALDCTETGATTLTVTLPAAGA